MLHLSVAIPVVAAALFVRLALLDGLGTRLAYITLYPAVTIAAAAGGYRAGSVAAALSALAASLWLAPLNGASDWLPIAHSRHLTFQPANLVIDYTVVCDPVLAFDKIHELIAR